MGSSRNPLIIDCESLNQTIEVYSKSKLISESGKVANDNSQSKVILVFIMFVLVSIIGLGNPGIHRRTKCIRI